MINTDGYTETDMNTRTCFLILGASLVFCVGIFHAQGDDNQPTQHSASLPSGDRWVEVKASKEKLLHALIDVANDDRADGGERARAWKLLAREGYVPAFEHAAQLLKDKEPGGSVFWTSFLESSIIDEDTINRLLKHKDPHVRMAGVFFAYTTENARALKEAAENDNDRDNQRYIWIAKARLGDYSILPEMARVAGDEKASDGDRKAAEAVLGAFIGVKESFTPKEFDKRLNEMIRMASPSTPASGPTANGM